MDSQPGTYPNPNGNDKKIYNIASDFAEKLQLPLVDGPIAALNSANLVSQDTADNLRPEDRRSRVGPSQGSSGTFASLFNRTFLAWLRQMQSRIPADNQLLQQDITKLIAATEFLADATLNTAQFVSRAVTSTVTARRMLWLHNWQADAKLKWRLASAPFTSGKLFRKAIEPILVETKDRRKILPSLHRRADRQLSPYVCNSSFQPAEASQGYFQRRFPQGTDRQTDRAEFRDRTKQQFQAKTPFRGSGGRPFRRYK